MPVSAIPTVPVSPSPVPAAPANRPSKQAPEGAVALARDTVDLTSASLGQSVVQPTTAAPTQEGRGTCGCERTPQNERRAVRRAERQADRLVQAADKRLDRLAKVFDGDEAAQKTIEALRSEFESQVRDATDAFVENGGKDRRALRAELREARKALREGIRDLIKSRLSPPTPPTPPTPSPTPTTPPPSEAAPSTEVPVAAGAGAGGTATTTPAIDSAPATPVPPTDSPSPAPITPDGNQQPASPATTRLVVTYTSFQFTFGATTDRIG